MNSKRILVISQTTDFQKVTRLSLTLAAWQVLSASSLQEGLAIAAVDHPDALLLNEDILTVEQKSAIEILRTHPATQTLPIVVVTGRARPAERQHFRSLGVSAVLPEWVSPVSLAQHIADALGWPHPNPE